jgi:hypothetical protein
VEVTRRATCPPEVAWTVLTDVATWPRWGPSVTAVRLDGPELGPGARGQVRTPGGLWLPFAITGWEEGRRWDWRVAGVPATGHRVAPDGAGCRVTFEVPWPAAPYVAVCRMALRRLADLLDEAPR